MTISDWEFWFAAFCGPFGIIPAGALIVLFITMARDLAYWDRVLEEDRKEREAFYKKLRSDDGKEED